MAHILDWGTYLRECRSLGDLLDTLDEGTQVDRSHVRVANELDEVVNDNHSAALDFHAPIIQRAQEQRDENSEGGGGDLRDKSRVGEGLDDRGH